MEKYKKIMGYVKIPVMFTYNLFYGSFKNAMLFSLSLIFFLAYLNFEVLRDSALNMDSKSMQKYITAIIMIAFFSTFLSLLKDPALKTFQWIRERVRENGKP